MKERIEFLPEDQVIKINVGGQIFSSTVKVWSRDRFSILARICTPESPLQTDSAGCVFFDRDWWIFRLIFLFLRDKTLPDSLQDLRELYYEASFYRLSLLRQAIEARLLKREQQQQRPEMDERRRGDYPLWSDHVPDRSRSSSSGHVDDPVTKASASATRPASRTTNVLPDPFGFTKC